MQPHLITMTTPLKSGRAKATKAQSQREQKPPLPLFCLEGGNSTLLEGSFCTSFAFNIWGGAQELRVLTRIVEGRSKR